MLFRSLGHSYINSRGCVAYPRSVIVIPLSEIEDVSVPVKQASDGGVADEDLVRGEANRQGQNGGEEEFVVGIPFNAGDLEEGALSVQMGQPEREKRDNRKVRHENPVGRVNEPPDDGAWSLQESFCYPYKTNGPAGCCEAGSHAFDGPKHREQ